MTIDAVVDVPDRSRHRNALGATRHGMEWKEESVNDISNAWECIVACVGIVAFAFVIWCITQ